MHLTRWILGAALSTLLVLGAYACVGDEPATPGSTDADAGGDGALGSDSQSGGDAADAGCDAGSALCGSSCINVTSDPANCGRCGHACGATAKCTASACAPILVTSLPDGGGSPILTLTTDQTDDNPAAAASHVFFSATNQGVFEDNVTGGNLIELSSPDTLSYVARSIVVHGSTVYWMGKDPINLAQPFFSATIGMAGTQASAGKMNGTPTAFTFDAVDSQLVGSYALSSAYGLFKCPVPIGANACTSLGTFSGGPGLNVATDGTTLFMPDKVDGSIALLPFASGSASSAPLAAGAAGTNIVHVNGTGGTGHLFWSSDSAPSLWRSNLGVDSTSAQQIATSATAADGMAVDALNIYWSESAGGTISYAPISGSGATTVYVTMGVSANPMRMVRDKQFLYFVHDTSIYRVALP